MVPHRRTSLERDPDLPAGIDLGGLPRAVRAELRGLSPESSEFVGGHLVMAGELVDSDPELAFAHAEAARRRASRLPVVREASAETAYAAGEYAHALREYRALRRMTGGVEYLPVMADCERALGRHDDALALTREAASSRELGPDSQAEALMVEAGVREDMGQTKEAVRLLKQATRTPARGLSRDSAVRLAYAYADLLLRTGDEPGAVSWFTRTTDLDRGHVTDAGDRLALLQGMVLEVDDAGIEPRAPEPPEDEDGGPTVEPDVEDEASRVGAEPTGDEPAGDEVRGDGSVGDAVPDDRDEPGTSPDDLVEPAREDDVREVETTADVPDEESAPDAVAPVVGAEGDNTAAAGADEGASTGDRAGDPVDEPATGAAVEDAATPGDER